MWPGCSAIIRNSTPTYTVAYNSSVSLAEKVQTLLNWIDLPLGKRPQLLAAYVSDVDSAGHKGGPDSKGVSLMQDEEYGERKEDKRVLIFIGETRKLNFGFLCR